MADRLVLHIGLMKSGTTFVQQRCDTNRELLAEQGILFPGPSWARQARAVSDLIGADHARPGRWEALREEVRAHPGTALVSMEYLAPMGPRRIARVLDDFADTDVRVVVTVRDLGRAVPAMWQETVKNRATWDWATYLEAVEQGGEAGRRFWRPQSADRIVARWAERAGADRVTVVTVPPPGSPPELLWERFCRVAGIGAAAWHEAPRSNQSLGAASALVMRRLNEELGDLPLPVYKKRVKTLAKHVLVRRRDHEPTIGFTVPDWLRARSERMVAGVAGTGVAVEGDLADLAPVDTPGVDPATVAPDLVLEAALAALGTVLCEGEPSRVGD